MVFGELQGCRTINMSGTPDGSGYGGGHMAFLQLIWGDGFLSPGGFEEVTRVLDGVDLKGRRVLDIGCGLGGIDRLIAENFSVAEVVGIDVEKSLIEEANRKNAGKAVADRVRFELVEPGPLPFPDASFDVVFSKDSILHVPDKDALAADAFRLLTPGGVVAMSDWLTGREGEPSAEMRRYLDAEGLGFVMATPCRYRIALERAGFSDIRMTDRNAWYRDLARQEQADLKDSLREAAIAMTSDVFVRSQLEVWRTMQAVLDSGELRPTHIRAVKRADGTVR